MSTFRYQDRDGFFDVTLPEGWLVERDGEGGVLLSTESGCGLLHLMPFQRDRAEEADPAEELYAFLADQEIELEEDEVEDIELPAGGSLALCEYVAEEGDESVYWLVGVATAPGQLLFASYSCPIDEAEQERETIRRIVGGVCFNSPL